MAKKKVVKDVQEEILPELPQSLTEAIDWLDVNTVNACLAFGVDYETESAAWVDAVTFRRGANGWTTEINGTRK